MKRNKLKLFKQLMFCSSLSVCEQILNAFAYQMNSQNVTRSDADVICISVNSCISIRVLKNMTILVVQDSTHALKQ